MNRIKLILLPLLLLLAVGSQAMAQLEVFLSPARRDYMLGEKVELKVTIVNHTDSSVVLTSTPGRSWLYLEVSHRGEGAVVPTSIPRYPNLTIMPGSRKSYTISLQPHFRLVREGTYRVRATLRMRICLRRIRRTQHRSTWPRAARCVTTWCKRVGSGWIWR